MKYLFLTNGASYFPTLTKDYHGAGVYNWYKCMEGEARLWPELKKSPEQLMDYDVIHINLAADDVGLAAEIHPFIKASDTKIVVNMDYSINYMDQSVHVHELIADIRASHCAFGVEPAQTNLLHYLATITKPDETKTMLLPHPVDMEYLAEKWIDYEIRGDTLAFHYHKYDGHLDIPWLLCYDLNVRWKALIGYTKLEFDIKEIPGFIVYPFMEWGKYIEMLSLCKYGLEYRTHKAASRYVMEAAALGIPVVSTTDSFMGTVLFPALTCPVEDFQGLRERLVRLTTDDEVRLTQARDGLERVRAYDFANSKKNMERLLE